MSQGARWLTESQAGMRRLFYFMPPDHSLDNLEHQRIKISNFADCNDLFELASMDLRDRALRDNHKAWIKKVGQSMGLICFSADWRSPLMWGHYAKNGTGICLVVDVPENHLHRVRYVSRREEMRESGSFPPLQDNDFYSFCSTKSYHWSYEKEYRLFIDLSQYSEEIEESGDMRFLKFGKTLRLAGAINGPKPIHSRVDIVRHLKGEYGFFQCRPAFRDFVMVMQQSKRLWN